MQRKYIVILGSLMSGLGKGVITSSIGKSLQIRGLKVVPIKFDGYLNVDCGTMNPYRHGEVFVLNDGTECDMDLGMYERFLNINLCEENNITGGKIFKLIIEKERRGGYLGYDVQIVPHLTNEIKRWIRRVGEKFNADVVLIEVGGTVGDLENAYFIEAIRQLAFEEKYVVFVQVTYVPVIRVTGEQKTKPTQHATKLLLSLGIQPDIIICRGEEKLTPEARKKISLFCNIPETSIIDGIDTKTIYEVPELFEQQRLSELLLKKLKIPSKNASLKKWNMLVEKIKYPKNFLVVGITGKYTAVRDAYVSIREALIHAGAHIDCEVKIKWIETTEIEKNKGALSLLKGCHGIIVPGGFGVRGIEGKIECIRYARENELPFLGLCLGMQLATIEYARNVVGMNGANSTEFDPNTRFPIVDLLPEQKGVKEKGGSMFLGLNEIIVKEGTLAHKIYNKRKIMERFRHRYEINPKYTKILEDKGLLFSGKAPNRELMYIVELPKHRFFIGTQFHPEFLSRLEAPHPIFKYFISACLIRKNR